MEMAKYILRILKSQLMIMFSWGFHNPVALDNYVEKTPNYEKKVQEYLNS